MKRVRAYFRLLAAVLFIALPPAGAAFAGNCANPTAPEGNMIFNDAQKLLQYCNGTNWIAMGRRGPGATVSSTNLVGYWTLDGVSGNTTAADSSANNFTGTLTNMNTTTAWGAGQVSNALTFDGTNDFVDIPFNAAFDITDDKVTLSAWVNAATTVGTRRIVSIPSYEVGGNEKYALLISSGNTQFWIGIQGSSDYNLQAAYTFTGSWHHIAGVYDGANMYLYIDGVQVDSRPMTGNVRASIDNSPLQIGSYGPDWGQYFGGALDDVRVYHRALSPAEVATLAGMGGAGGTCSGPTGAKGQVLYNSAFHVMQFCDGYNWIAMGK